MARYHFVTRFDVAAARDDVWALVDDPTTWPSWWRWLRRVDQLGPGGAGRVGARYRYAFKTALPYTLSFETQTMRAEPGSLIEVRSTGELAGSGLWQLSERDGQCQMRYDWIVETTKRWMNVLAPVARRAFSWNHDRLMRDFATGFARQLGTEPGSLENRTVDRRDPSFGKLPSTAV